MTGVVTNIKRRERGRKFAAYGLPSIQSLVAEVAPDSGGGVWTVPVEMLKIIGKADLKKALAARTTVADVKAARAGFDAERKHTRWAAADAAGLESLKPGDPVEIQFRDIGWSPRVFVKMSSSGQVGFVRNKEAFDSLQNAGDILSRVDQILGQGKPKVSVRFLPAQYARVPASS